MAAIATAHVQGTDDAERGVLADELNIDWRTAA